jgi:hypothetical protein
MPFAQSAIPSQPAASPGQMQMGEIKPPGGQ